MTNRASERARRQSEGSGDLRGKYGWSKIKDPRPSSPPSGTGGPSSWVLEEELADKKRRGSAVVSKATPAQLRRMVGGTPFTPAVSTNADPPAPGPSQFDLMRVRSRSADVHPTDLDDSDRREARRRFGSDGARDASTSDGARDASTSDGASGDEASIGEEVWEEELVAYSDEKGNWRHHHSDGSFWNQARASGDDNSREENRSLPSGERSHPSIPHWFSFDGSLDGSEGRTDNDSEFSYESGSLAWEYYDDEDEGPRPKRRLPKLMRDKVLKEPRPLTEFSEDMPKAKWPDNFKCVFDTPMLRAQTPFKTEAFTFPPPVKDAPVSETFFEPVVVYEAKNSASAVADTTERAIDEFNPSLRFESRFECGNLQSATRVGPTSYDLQLRKDINTKGHTQWFYFRVRKMVPGIAYHFHITNLMKTSSLYSNGMRPLMYSTHSAATKGLGWHRVGTDISYSRNPPPQPPEDEPTRPFFTLAFTVTFDVADDTCYFAHCYPYSYTDLQEDLARLKADPERAKVLRHTVLARSVIGNNVDLVTITSPAQTPGELAGRRGIVVSARVHPGETNASFMMRGLLNFLTSSSAEAQYLRERYVMKIVPMLNPDGVIVGNYRCNIYGFDLNRCWRPRSPEWSRTKTPEIYGVKDMIARTMQSRELALYCDLHGHNRKQGIFLYGCHNDDDDGECDGAPGRPPRPCHYTRRYRERVFPLMLSRNATDLFSFRKCQFRMQKSKEGTGRITVRRSCGIIDSFTLEASFCGSAISPKGGFHFMTSDLERMGEIFGKTLYEYYCDDGRAAEKLYEEISRGFDHGDSTLQPDDSATSETTSDDEVLRISTTKKKRRKKRIPSYPLRPASAASESKYGTRAVASQVQVKVENTPPKPTSKPERNGLKPTPRRRSNESRPMSRAQHHDDEPTKKIQPLQVPAVVRFQTSGKAANGSNLNPIFLELSSSQIHLDSPLKAPKARSTKTRQPKSDEIVREPSIYVTDIAHFMNGEGGAPGEAYITSEHPRMKPDRPLYTSQTRVMPSRDSTSGGMAVAAAPPTRYDFSALTTVASASQHDERMHPPPRAETPSPTSAPATRPGSALGARKQPA
ncbi:Cytosolic carboxypeptidase 2, partial [Irineochytrium annulatum]